MKSCMSQKRANGEGTVFYDKSRKRWVALVRSSVDGKNLHRKRTARSKADAKQLLDQLRDEIYGTSPAAVAHTVGSYLDEWIATHVKPNRAPTTTYSYEKAIKNWIKPYLGNLPLSRISALSIQRALNSMAEAGAGDRTRQNAFKVLQAALSQAVRWQILPANPCAAVAAPRVQSRDIQPFTAAEAKKILDHTKGTEFHAAYVLAFQTGMRGCELWGLRWSDIDWDGKRLHIRESVTETKGQVHIGPPKSRHSARTISLTDHAIEALVDRRAWCMKKEMAGRVRVFTPWKGDVMRRGEWRRWRWDKLLKTLKLKHRGFHHTRHTYATLALAAGVPVAEVAATLGHHSPAVTWSFYAHAIPDQESRATHAVSAAIAGAQEELTTEVTDSPQSPDEPRAAVAPRLLPSHSESRKKKASPES